VPTFVRRVADQASRAEWDKDITATVQSYEPDLVVLAGFMKLMGPAFLEAYEGRVINTHPALLPSFPGMHAPRDALEHGVRVTGATLFFVDDGVDAGPIIAQVTEPVLEDDDVDALHERIKARERAMLVEFVGRMVREGYRIDGRKVRIGL
jgi:phosphoribosylglycinamide formyltransferase-1